MANKKLKVRRDGSRLSGARSKHALPTTTAVVQSEKRTSQHSAAIVVPDFEVELE